MTKAEKFIKKSKEIMPHHSELQEIDPSIDSYDHIDEIIFRKSQYLGGVASVIIEIIK